MTVLYRKWRPRTWDAMIGQEHVVNALRAAVTDPQPDNIWLLSGPRGTGKTTAARLVAAALNCPDTRNGNPCGTCQICEPIWAGRSQLVTEIDAATNRTTEDIERILATARLQPVGTWTVTILDECHMLSKAAAVTLTRGFESLPDRSVFILATTDPHKLPPVLRGHCRHLETRLLTETELTEHIKRIVEAEQLPVTDDTITRVVTSGHGSVRDTLSILEAAVNAEGAVTYRTEQFAAALIDTLADACTDPDRHHAPLVTIREAVTAGCDPTVLAEQTLTALQTGFTALIGARTGTNPAVTACRKLGTRRTVRAAEQISETLIEMRHATDPETVLAMTVLRFIRTETSTPPDWEHLAARITRLETGTPPPAPTQNPTPPAPAPTELPEDLHTAVTTIWADHVLPRLGAARTRWKTGTVTNVTDQKITVTFPDQNTANRATRDTEHVASVLAALLHQPVTVTVTHTPPAPTPQPAPPTSLLWEALTLAFPGAEQVT